MCYDFTHKYLDKRKDPDPVKFHDFGKEYLQWSKANKKPSTYEIEISFMRKWDKEFETKTLQDITPWLIEKWKAKRKEEIKPASIESSTC
jgi:hypothetical protein